MFRAINNKESCVLPISFIWEERTPYVSFGIHFLSYHLIWWWKMKQYNNITEFMEDMNNEK